MMTTVSASGSVDAWVVMMTAMAIVIGRDHAVQTRGRAHPRCHAECERHRERHDGGCEAAEEVSPERREVVFPAVQLHRPCASRKRWTVASKE